MQQGKSKGAEAGTVGTDQCAKLLDITPEWLRRLTASGQIPKRARGRYNLVEAVHGYVKFLREDAARNTKTAQLSRMQEAKAAEIEMRLAEKRRELVPVDEVQAAIDIMIAKFRDELSGLPARFTRDMDLRRKLEAETNASLNRIAKALAASAEFIEKGGDLPDGGSSDDA